MNWQTSGGAPADDPFAKAEADVRAMTSSAWWQTAAPQQRAEQVVSRLLAGPGEWWLYGAWGRWYRCGLDGHWHPSPPPADLAQRRVLAPAPPGVGNPPVPPQLIPTGHDIGAGLMAGAGLLSEGPSAELVARVQQTLVTAIAVDPQQFAMQDPAFQPGTPTTVAALWGAVLFSAGTPVVLGEHPLVAMFAPYLTVQAHHLRWMIAPDLTRLAVYYTDRLGARDPVGAAFVVRMMGELAAALATDRAFQPGASALAAICATTLQYVQADQQAMAYGAPTVAKEWLRRCPAEYAAPIVREASPGEYLRLALYDLALLYGDLTEGTSRPPAELRRAAAAVFAADLQTIPQAVPAVLPWLDPESARTVQEVLAQAQHPLRELFPQGVRLPPGLSSTDAGKVRALLALTHTLAMTACRLAQTAPQHLEFIVPAACAAELGTPALSRPKSTGEPSAWEIINAARRHLADERGATQSNPTPATPPSAPPPSPAPLPHDDDPFATRPGTLPPSNPFASPSQPAPHGQGTSESGSSPFDASGAPASAHAAEPPQHGAPTPYGQGGSEGNAPSPYGQGTPEGNAPPPYGAPASSHVQGPSEGTAPPPYDPSSRPASAHGSEVPAYGSPAGYGQGSSEGGAPPPFDASARPGSAQGGEASPFAPYGQATPDAGAPYDPSARPASAHASEAPPYGSPGQGASEGGASSPYAPSAQGGDAAPYASPAYGHGGSDASAPPPFDPSARPASDQGAYGSPAPSAQAQSGGAPPPFDPSARPASDQGGYGSAASSGQAQGAADGGAPPPFDPSARPVSDQGGYGSPASSGQAQSASEGGALPPFDPSARPVSDHGGAYGSPAQGQGASEAGAIPPYDPSARPSGQGNAVPPFGSASPAHGQGAGENNAVPPYDPSARPVPGQGNAVPPYGSTSPAHGEGGAPPPFDPSARPGGAVPPFDASAQPLSGGAVPPYDPSASPVHGHGSEAGAPPPYDASARPASGQGAVPPPYDPSARPGHGSAGGGAAPPFDPTASPAHGHGSEGGVPPYDPSARPASGQGGGIPPYDPSAQPAHGHAASESSGIPPYDPSGQGAEPVYDAYGQLVGSGASGREGEAQAYDAYGQPVSSGAQAGQVDATAPYRPEFTGSGQVPDGTAPYLPTFAGQAPPAPPQARPSDAHGQQAAPSGGTVVEAYGIRFLCGADDIERMLTEVRRRGKWAQQLRGQEVSSASAPAVLLVGAPSTGQRRLGRMIARALSDVGFSGDRLRNLHLEQVREAGPDGLTAVLDAHAGETVLLEGLDELVFDDGQGDAYARALYRVRAEGVTTTTLIASVRPERFEEFAAAHPELITDFRTVRLPDLDKDEVRLNLLALLAAERFVTIDDEAWRIIRGEFAQLGGRGRLVNARLVEAFLDRACTRHLGTADDTLSVLGDPGFRLTPQDVTGIASELPR
ncbi:hypothetical protein [Actinocorallia sp. A-T 12471]|uniref:hypothetical protein n=1 Tax=Actinocorallia sp. A-T 12471 TaxID=3089813 RepID=UPI0029CC2736|nr:hypothetical protein [Actinocorallia sp. A-T 12471]MDX6741250.1 hypothetical protein [Actinocorallia sp. A-T 12471]